MSISKKHLPILKYLAKGKPRIVKAIIKEGEPEVLRAVCECAHNLLRGNIPMNSKQFKKMKRYSKQLRLLTNKKVSVKRKKKVIQNGGFLGGLLSVAIPAIASLVGGLIKK